MNWTDAHPRYAPGYHNRAAKIGGTIFTAVWLIYLVGPVVDLFTGHYSALYRWGGLAIIVVFSALYVTLVPNWPKPYRFTLSGLAVLALLAGAACVLYGGTGAVTCGSSCRPPPACWCRAGAGPSGPCSAASPAT